MACQCVGCAAEPSDLRFMNRRRVAAASCIREAAWVPLVYHSAKFRDSSRHSELLSCCVMLLSGGEGRRVSGIWLVSGALAC